jgi:esterase/lipase superfamily enzyme
VLRFSIAFMLARGLASCADRTIAPVLPEAASIGATETVLVATTRQTDSNGFFGSARTDDIAYVEVDISIPPNHRPGTLSTTSMTPNPDRHFAISRQTDLKSASGFENAIRKKLLANPAGQRDVLVYVHGYNNSFSDGVFRTAQLSHDFELPEISLAYSWPSEAHALGYSHDRDSALFARDGLETMLRKLPGTGANRITLVAHSMGSLLVMETLRQIEIATPGWSEGNLDGVVLISPDVDLDLFRHQASRIRELPQPFAVFASKNDRVLRLSAQINGRSRRLGQMTDASELAEFPLILVDVSDFADGGLGPNHFTVGTSPALIKLLGQSQELQQVFQRDPSGRAGTLPRTVITVQNATQMVLSPGLLRQN